MRRQCWVRESRSKHSVGGGGIVAMQFDVRIADDPGETVEIAVGVGAQRRGGEHV